MHPAFSVIFFTVVSGAGYGLLFLIGLIAATSPQALAGQWLLPLALGAIFAAAGLTSSTLHLGQPQRAWRAFSQWRSSWLSREGVVAIASFMPLAALAWLLWRGADAAPLRVAGGMLTLLALATVYCTARIYTSLKTIHAWHNRYVLPGYLLLGLLGGAASLWALRVAHDHETNAAPACVALLALAAAVLKQRYWRYIDTTSHAATPESATGLGRFGAVRSVEAPHTEENYLTREMGFVLARRHSSRLRRIAIVLLGAIPAALALLALAAPTLFAFGWMLAPVAALSTIAGTFVERWLFFAEAKHVVTLYYGAGRS